MEIYQLKYFEATARTGSIGAAARACHVTQPALSVQIKALEAELGIQLFERHARGVKLTRAGERVMRTARQLIIELEQLRHDIRRRNFGAQPTLRIGIQPFLATELLARPMRQFMDAMAGWQVMLRERPNDLLLELLLNREVEVSLMSRPARWPAGLTTRRLFELPFAVYCRTSHPLAVRDQVTLRDVLPFPLILWNDPIDTAARLRRMARKLKVGAHVVFTSDMATTGFAMAAEGAGVAILPAIFAGRCVRAGMRQLSLSDHRLAAGVYAVWRRDAQVPDGLATLISLCQDSMVGTNG